MSKSVEMRRAGDRLALTDEEIAEIVGIAVDNLPVQEKKIEEVTAPDAASSDDAFLGRRWGLQSRLH